MLICFYIWIYIIDKNQKNHWIDSGFIKNKVNRMMKIPQKSSRNFVKNFGNSGKWAKGQKSIMFLSKFMPQEKFTQISRNKEQRTRSHDPTSAIRFRSSIQPNEDSDKILVNVQLRTNSERKQRNQTNATVAHPHFLPQIHSQRTHFIIPKIISKVNLPQPNNLNFQRHSQGKAQEYRKELAITAKFGSVVMKNQNSHKFLIGTSPSGICFEKSSVASPRENRLWSPSKLSFLSDGNREINFSDLTNKLCATKPPRFPSTRISRKLSFKNRIAGINNWKDVFSQERKYTKVCLDMDIGKRESEIKEKGFQNPFKVLSKKKPKIMLKLLSKKMKKKTNPIKT